MCFQHFSTFVMHSARVGPVHRFNELQRLSGGRIDLNANLVGACDQNSDCRHFIMKNHSPRHLTCASLCMSVQWCHKFPVSLRLANAELVKPSVSDVPFKHFRQNMKLQILVQVRNLGGRHEGTKDR